MAPSDSCSSTSFKLALMREVTVVVEAGVPGLTTRSSTGLERLTAPENTLSSASSLGWSMRTLTSRLSAPPSSTNVMSSSM